MMVVFCGKQIVLRDWRVADLDAWARWMQPHQRWHALDGPYYRKAGAADIPALVERRRAAIEANDLPAPRTSLVIAAQHTGALLGTVTWYWESEETWWLSVGISIFDPQHWGRGIGYEALGLWSQYLFDALPQIVRLDLRTWSGNTGMLRLAQKLGYQEEARFRMARIVHGAYYDGMGYGVLRSEWQARYGQGFAAHLHNE